MAITGPTCCPFGNSDELHLYGLANFTNYLVGKTRLILAIIESMQKMLKPYWKKERGEKRGINNLPAEIGTKLKATTTELNKLFVEIEKIRGVKRGFFPTVGINFSAHSVDIEKLASLSKQYCLLKKVLLLFLYDLRRSFLKVRASQQKNIALIEQQLGSFFDRPLYAKFSAHKDMLKEIMKKYLASYLVRSKKCALCPNTFALKQNEKSKITLLYRDGMHFAHLACLEKQLNTSAKKYYKIDFSYALPRNLAVINIGHYLLCIIASRMFLGLFFEEEICDTQEYKKSFMLYLAFCIFPSVFFYLVEDGTMPLPLTGIALIILGNFYVRTQGVYPDFSLLRQIGYTTAIGCFLNITVLSLFQLFIKKNKDNIVYLLSLMTFSFLVAYQVMSPMHCEELITVDKVCWFCTLFLILQDSFVISITIHQLRSQLSEEYDRIKWQLHEIEEGIFKPLMVLASKIALIFVGFTIAYYLVIEYYSFHKNSPTAKMIDSIIEKAPVFIVSYICNFLFFLKGYAFFLRTQRFITSSIGKICCGIAFCKKKIQKIADPNLQNFFRYVVKDIFDSFEGLAILAQGLPGKSRTLLDSWSTAIKYSFHSLQRKLRENT